MQRLQGIAVSPGVAIGDSLVMDNEGFRIPLRFVARDAVEDELHRLDEAIAAASRETERNRDSVAQQLGDQYAAIFSAHLRIVRDPHLRREVEKLVRDRHFSPEHAVSRVLRRYAKVFQSLDNHYLAERANDIFDIEKRLLRLLLGRRREELAQLTSPVLILAHNLTPSETANLDRKFVKGFVTEVGGPGSHTAIVAEALRIPAIVGTGPFLTDLSGGEQVIIDGDQGLVIVEPDEQTVKKYRREAEEQRSLAVKLRSLRDLRAETADGTRIQLLGNIEFPYEVPLCQEQGSDGIGLYRTEFLYLGADKEPTEQDQYEAYAAVIRAMKGQAVVIRTLDLGADKMRHVLQSDDERNPFLGLRSLRLSLRNVPMFRTQLRAILRATPLGDVRIMFPMVSTLMEFRQAKMILADVMEDLTEQGVEFNADVPVGMMVEVPAAVVMMDCFVHEVDFFSIGTNDLIQYTLAVDRSNKDVASLYTPSDPSVIRLIDMSIKTADKHSVPINLCGQMSGIARYTMLLAGLGLRSFSVTPSAIPEIKRVCRGATIGQCEAVARRALTMECARDIKSYLTEELHRVVPEVVV